MKIKTNEQILSYNKNLKRDMNWILVGFTVAMGGAILFDNIMSGIYGIIAMQLITSMNHSRNINEAIINLRGEEKNV